MSRTSLAIGAWCSLRVHIVLRLKDFGVRSHVVSYYLRLDGGGA